MMFVCLWSQNQTFKRTFCCSQVNGTRRHRMFALQGEVAFATRTDASSRHQGTLPAGGSTVVNALLSARWQHCVNMLPVDGSSSCNTSSSSGSVVQSKIPVLSFKRESPIY